MSKPNNKATKKPNNTASKKPGWTTVAMLAVGLLGGLAAGCGGVANSDAQTARDQATTASCNYFKMCGQIGATGTYDTYSDCQAQVLSYWTGQWSDTDCRGKVDQAALSVCVQAINSTLCANGLDVLATLYAKCPLARVCPTATPDAGRD